MIEQSAFAFASHPSAILEHLGGLIAVISSYPLVTSILWSLSGLYYLAQRRVAKAPRRAG